MLIPAFFLTNKSKKAVNKFEDTISKGETVKTETETNKKTHSKIFK
jgi:hypothetical protein